MEGWEACLENTRQPWGRWGWQEQTREAGNARSDLEPGKSILKSLFNDIWSPGWDRSPWVWLLCWRYLKSWCWHDVLGDLPPSSWQSGSSPKKLTIALLSTAFCRVDCSPLGPRCWAFEIWKLQSPSPVCHAWGQMSWIYVINNHDILLWKALVWGSRPSPQFEHLTWGGNQAAETAAGAEATTMPGIPFRMAEMWQRMVNKLWRIKIS